MLNKVDNGMDNQNLDMVDTIFFDLGNTLVNYHKGKLSDEEKDFLGLKKMYEYLKRFDDNLTFTKLHEDFYIKWLNKLSDRDSRQVEYNVNSFLLKAMPETARNKITEDEIVKAFKIFHEPNIRFVECEDDLAETLSALRKKKMKLAIISNSPIPGYCHDETLKSLDLLKFFNKRFYSYDLNFKKPSREIFAYAIRCVDTKFKDSIFIGDSLKKDIIPALSVNMKAVFLNNRNTIVPEEVTNNKNFLGEVNSLSELISFLS